MVNKSTHTIPTTTDKTYRKPFYRFRFSLSILLIIQPIAFCASSAPYEIKKTIKTLLSYEISELQKAKNQPPPKFVSEIIPLSQWKHYELTPQEWEKEINRQQEPLQNLLALVDQTVPERLAEVIINLYWGKGQNTEIYPSLENYAMALGESAVPYIQRDYDQAGPESQLKMLNLLVHIHSRGTLATVKKGLDSQDERISATAQTALRIILGIEAMPELEKILLLSKSSWYIEHTLREMSLTGDPDWYRSFFAMVRKGIVPLHNLVNIINPANCPEQVIGENADLLAEIISVPSVVNNQSNKLFARELILKLTQPDHIRRLTRLLPGLLHDRYRYGGVLKSYMLLSAAQQEKELGFFDEQADHLITKITQVLSVEELSGLLNREPGNTLNRLYLESLLKLKTAPSITAKEENYNFRVVVFNSMKQLIISQDFYIKPNEEQTVVLKPLNKKYAEHHLKAALRLNRSEWALTMACGIDFKPAGASFDLDIPIGGSSEINLYDTNAGERELLVWQFQHLDRIVKNSVHK